MRCPALRLSRRMCIDSWTEASWRESQGDDSHRLLAPVPPGTDSVIVDGQRFPHGMQVFTFCSLQEPVLAQTTFGKVQRQPPQVPAVTWTTAQVFRHRCMTHFPPMPHHSRLALHVGPVSAHSPACLIQHCAQDTRAPCYTPTGGRCSPVTSCDQTVVFYCPYI